jgi:hypothetical protein
VAQRQLPQHPATLAPGRVAQPADASWYTLARKKPFDSWHDVYQVWGRYQIGKDSWEWIEIGKALDCALPPKVGHASGSIGDSQDHVNNAVKLYIENVVQPAAHFAHPGKKRKWLYRALVL